MIPAFATGIWASIKAAKATITLTAFGVLLALLTVQTVRIDGFKFLFVSVEGWKPKAERLAIALDQVEAAQIIASQQQAAAMQAEQDRYDALAERTQNAHQTTRIVVRDATDRFIADSVQCAPDRSVASATSAPADSDGAAVPETVPAHIVMDTADVRSCAALYAYALDAYNWAAELER